MITVVHDGVEVHFDDTDVNAQSPGLVHGSLLANRFYEQGFLEYIRSLGLHGAYVDVGAFIGTHTLYFAVFCGADTVHSFEPRAAVFERLRCNVELNGLEDRVRLHRVALTREPGEFTLTMGRDSSVVPGGRLDDYVADDVAVIKMDVEGMEPEVLAGAGVVLRRSRPVVFAEARTGPEYAAVVEAMREHRYIPTGRCFNATPTYEFVPRPGRIRRLIDSGTGIGLRRRIPAGIRRRLRRFVIPVRASGHRRLR